jgi:hypothetical protein
MKKWWTLLDSNQKGYPMASPELQALAKVENATVHILAHMNSLNWLKLLGPGLT